MITLTFLFIYFKIIFYWLCYYSCPDCSPIAPSTQHPPVLRQWLHHYSCPWVLCISSLAAPFSMLYCTPPWLFCNYLFVLLNPSPYLFPQTPRPSGNPQNALCIHNSVSVLVGLVCFFDSTFDRYVFVAILLWLYENIPMSEVKHTRLLTCLFGCTCVLRRWRRKNSSMKMERQCAIMLNKSEKCNFLLFYH